MNLPEDESHETDRIADVDVDNFHNCAASEAFIQELAGLVNQGDVEAMIRAQKQMLQRFEKTNEMLLNCNALSQSRLKQATDDFKRHCKVLAKMKKDLEYIFRKIKSVKQKLSHQYPTAFAECQLQRSNFAEEATDDIELGKLSCTKFCKAEVLSKSCTGQQLHSSTTPSTTTVEYVQMEETIDNGKPIENELIKKICSPESINPNDSSDCTSEDTA